MGTSGKQLLAILDDYQGIAASKFLKLRSRVEVQTFKDNLNANDSTQRSALIERLKPFSIISTMRERTGFPAEVVSALPNLRLLLTTGLKNAAIDLNACADHGIVVAGAKGRSPTSLDSTMQHTWALILGIVRNISRDDTVVKSGGWETSFATGLKGKTLGLLGLGKLGADTARVGVLAFGMKVIAWSTSLTQEAADEKAKGYGLAAGTFQVAKSKEELFKEADVLSIHYVLSPRSQGIVGPSELNVMKPTAFFINTSRAPLVEERALLKVLKEGKIRGAALDVYNREPLLPDDAWRTTRWGSGGRAQVLLSPHQGYVEEDVMDAWYEETADNVEKWLDGKELATKMN